ncbi:hypothetical protein IC235_16265 [Hymenobacter sp. BT664]|uniref:Uncharacterized protein n=1 Tax=Hymenobacter montanus TaxID=2771359 RepID=A0A927BEL7_9BACT|nr:hypothetical protein [Hymenobacter montanus]MBD2769445.1 hypothetical protein [Hymenobacter montanus]
MDAKIRIYFGIDLVQATFYSQAFGSCIGNPDVHTSHSLSDPWLRQRAVAFALNLAQNTFLEPGEQERALLRQFEAGELSVDQLEAQLDKLTPSRREEQSVSGRATH